MSRTQGLETKKGQTPKQLKPSKDMEIKSINSNELIEIEKLKEKLLHLEKENKDLTEQLFIKNDVSHHDKLMAELNERAMFVRDFCYFLKLFLFI